MSIEILISFCLASAALAVSPGPDNIFVLVQSLTYGRKSGIAIVCGLISGCIVHTTLVAFGAAALIKANDNLFLVLKLLGAAYMLYLAFKVYRGPDKLELKAEDIRRQNFSGLFKTGFIMNVINPKVSIFFLAFFPGFLFSETMGTVTQFYILGFLFMAVSFVIFSAIALLAGIISEYTNSHPGIGKVFKWMQIIVFLLIGLLILLSEK